MGEESDLRAYRGKSAYTTTPCLAHLRHLCLPSILRSTLPRVHRWPGRRICGRSFLRPLRQAGCFPCCQKLLKLSATLNRCLLSQFWSRYRPTVADNLTHPGLRWPPERLEPDRLGIDPKFFDGTLGSAVGERMIRKRSREKVRSFALTGNGLRASTGRARRTASLRTRACIERRALSRLRSRRTVCCAGSALPTESGSWDSRAGRGRAPRASRRAAIRVRLSIPSALILIERRDREGSSPRRAP